MRRNIMTFADLSDRAQGVFGDEATFEGFKNLTHDLSFGLDIYDEDGAKVNKKEAEDKARSFVFNFLGLNEKSSKRARKRAMKKYGDELFAILEEDIDMKVDTGFHESEFFNNFVDMRNIAQDDRQEFWTDDDVILSVVKVAGDHHDFTLQRLGAGQSYTVPTSVYGIAVGADIDMYLLGKLDWSKLTDACARAFVLHIQNEMFNEVMNAGTKLPAQFQKTGALGAATKDQFDELIEDVTIANDYAPVYVLGTKTALKKLTALADVDWITREQKEDVARTGRLGYYEGVTLFEVPQRFAVNDTSKKLLPNDELLILAQTEDKFVKFVDVGETEINEITEKGEANGRMDDTMKYEVQREMGIGTQISRYFGTWKITA